MSDKPSLSMQRMAVEHLIALAGGDASDTIVSAAKSAALTIGWLERQADLLKMFDRLRRDSPELFAQMKTLAGVFPEASIADIRSTDPWQPKYDAAE